MDDDLEPNFEIALAELERIVASLERGEPELTAALSKYEKGVQLLSICHRLLEKAEHSVAILTGVDEQGDALTAPFDATATITSEAKSPATLAETDTSPSERKRKGPEKTVVRRGRTAPADPTIDPDDPPF
jgi:exodeoxyribonuclease VII small subunit